MKTDNSAWALKVRIRESCIRTGRERVLDAFAGKGLLWTHITSLHPGLKVTSLEMEDGKNPRAIEGDNLKIMAGMDLQRYDIIDLDAYGVPWKQLQVLHSRGYRGCIIFTWIPGNFNTYPTPLLEMMGFSREQCRAAPLLVGKAAKNDALPSVFAHMGRNSIRYYRTGRHHIYGVAL